MDPLTKSLYLFFYGKTTNVLKNIKHPVPSKTVLERLFHTNGARTLVEKYMVFRSDLYFRFLEIKSADAREEWGLQATHHSRNIRNVK